MALQEYVKCMEKKDKYSARERTGPNVVKLENVCMLLSFVVFAGPMLILHSRLKQALLLLLLLLLAFV